MPDNKPAKIKPGGDVERVKPRTIEELKALVLQGRDEVTMDPKEVEQRIFDRMMSATTPEAALGASQATKGEDIIGKNFTIHSVDFLDSDFKDGIGIFAVMNATMDGVPHAVTCGARTIVAQLLKFDFEGWFPARVKIHQSGKPTSNGYLPMELVPGDPVEEPF